MTGWVSRGLALTAVVALLATGCGGPASSAPEPTAGTVVRIAAASDLRFALEEVADLVKSEHPDVELAVTYGSSGQFVQQIGNGAPFDLFLSADLAYPEQLVDEGLAESGDVFSYGIGRLVLWAAEESSVDPREGLAVLADPAVRTVAIANPEHAPYGRAAVEALQSAGVWDVVEPKLVLGENVSQAADFVRSGNADAGVVALSLVLAPSAKDEGRWAEVPLELFSPLEQGGVVLAGARDPAATRAVRDVLTGEEGRAVLAAYGFSPADRA
jgi:molybdate transport system substrate-binding protein